MPLPVVMVAVAARPADATPLVQQKLVLDSTNSQVVTNSGDYVKSKSTP